MGAVRTVDVSVSAAEQGTQVAFDSESKTEPPDTGRARAVVERFGPFGQAFGFSSGAVSTADFVLGSFAGSNDVLTALSTVPTGVSRAYQHNTPDLEVRSELDYSASFDASITANHRFNFLLRGMRLTINSSSAEYDLTNPYTATLGAEIRFRNDLIYSFTADLEAAQDQRNFSLSTFGANPANFPVFTPGADDDPNNFIHSFVAPAQMISLDLGPIGQGSRFTVDYFAFTDAATPGTLVLEQTARAAFGDPANLALIDPRSPLFNPNLIVLNQDPNNPNFAFDVTAIPANGVPAPQSLFLTMGGLALLGLRKGWNGDMRKEGKLRQARSDSHD